MAPSLGRGILSPAVGETKALSTCMVASGPRAVKKEARVQSKLPAFMAVSLGTAPWSSSLPVDRSATGSVLSAGVLA